MSFYTIMLKVMKEKDENRQLECTEGRRGGSELATLRQIEYDYGHFRC